MTEFPRLTPRLRLEPLPLWADVATKRDLDILQHRTEALIQREVSGLRLDVAREIGTLRDEIVPQTRTIIGSTVGILASAAGLAFGLAQFVR